MFLLLVIFNREITAKEAGEVIGVSERMVKKYIKKLKDHNIIERSGASTFGGHWQIKQ
jgi:predicted HTH transcriptional regulator